MSLTVQQNLQIIETDDGSQTVLNRQLGSTYHSVFGAVTESRHIFIDKGLKKLLVNPVTQVTVLEIGFGTGLNALLGLLFTMENEIQMDYHSIEPFPLPESIWSAYRLPPDLFHVRQVFEQMHRSPWNSSVRLTDRFSLNKHKLRLSEFRSEKQFNLIFFDAFEPQKQPELWTEEVFSRLFNMMDKGGILTTYCAKGDVRRAMIRVGFEVERIPGPPGKREMIRANVPL